MLRNADTLALELLAGLVREGGETVPMIVGQSVPSRGYVVGGVRPTVTLAKREVRQWLVREWAAAQSRHYGHEAASTKVFLGAWQAPDTGDVHLDVVQVIPNLEFALDLARARGEEAVYDLATGETLYA